MRLLLVDGHYYCFRSYYAIRSLTNAAGESTNAIYGFVKTIRKMLKDLRPDMAAVLWDQGLPKRRTELQPEYKATRSETPADLGPQIDFIRKMTPLFGTASIGVQDTEADDLIATYATVARARGDEVIIATNDKDIFQLVDGGCRIYSTNKTDLANPADGFALLGEAEVTAKWGVPPRQIGEVLALTGDAVDNIPGVEGIGIKTAVTLLTANGGLDALLADLTVVKSERTRAKLAASTQLIAANREMVRLDLDLPLPVPLDDLKITPRPAELAATLEACGFKSLTNEVRAEAARPAALAAPPAPVQAELF